MDKNTMVRHMSVGQKLNGHEISRIFQIRDPFEGVHNHGRLFRIVDAGGYTYDAYEDARAYELERD